MKSLSGLILALAASSLLAGGCSSDSNTMSAQETAQFKGTPAQPMTDAKKKEMADFQERFRKMHPQNHGGAAPATAG